MVKNSSTDAGDVDWIPGSEKSPGGGNGNPILDWKTLWSEEPGRPQSMGLQRVRHD